MNPLQAAPASDKHQDNQMEGTGAANDQCHLVVIETILHLYCYTMCKQMQQLPTLMHPCCHILGLDIKDS